MTYSKIIAGALCLSAVAFISCKGGKKGDTADTNKKDSTAVAVAKPGSSVVLNPNKKYIYLTWDDSPQPPGTTNCLRVFREQGVKATFFTVGGNVVGPLKERLVDTLNKSYPQFLMANHSWTHASNKYKWFYEHPDSAINDFMRMQTTYNVPVKIIRLPGMNSWVLNKEISGQKTPAEVCKRLDSLGYSVIGWDVEWQQGPHSAPIQSAEVMAQMVKNKLANGETKAQNAIVILSHDRLFGKQQYADSLAKFITLLKQDTSYVFETIDHYPLVQNQ